MTGVVLDALDRDGTIATITRVAPDVVLYLMSDLGTGDSASNARLRTVVPGIWSTRLGPSRAYKQRRLAEGKTTREVKRMLKRYIARQIYRQLTATMTA